MMNSDNLPVTLLAPFDVVYDKDKKYIGIVGEEGPACNGEDITVPFLRGAPRVFHISDTVYVPQQDHTDVASQLDLR